MGNKNGRYERPKKLQPHPGGDDHIFGCVCPTSCPNFLRDNCPLAGFCCAGPLEPPPSDAEDNKDAEAKEKEKEKKSEQPKGTVRDKPAPEVTRCPTCLNDCRKKTRRPIVYQITKQQARQAVAAAFKPYEAALRCAIQNWPMSCSESDSDSDECQSDSCSDDYESDSNSDNCESDSNSDECESDNNSDECESDNNSDDSQSDSKSSNSDSSDDDDKPKPRKRRKKSKSTRRCSRSRKNSRRRRTR